MKETGLAEADKDGGAKFIDQGEEGAKFIGHNLLKSERVEQVIAIGDGVEAEVRVPEEGGCGEDIGDTSRTRDALEKSTRGSGRERGRTHLECYHRTRDISEDLLTKEHHKH